MREIAQRLLGGGAASLDWDEALFDFVWMFGRRDDSWIHKQVPQRVFAGGGDSEAPADGRRVMTTSLR